MRVWTAEGDAALDQLQIAGELLAGQRVGVEALEPAASSQELSAVKHLSCVPKGAGRVKPSVKAGNAPDAHRITPPVDGVYATRT